MFNLTFCAIIICVVGSEASTEIVESGVGLLFETFAGSELVTHAHTMKLRGIFGPFPASSATKACKTVNRITGWLPGEIAESLLTRTAETVLDESTTVFGRNIKFSYPDQPNMEEFDWLDSGSDDETSAISQFDMKYVSQATESGSGKKGNKVGGHWLRSKVEESFGGPETGLGMSITDVCSHIFDVLSSAKSDEALQNEVGTK